MLKLTPGRVRILDLDGSVTATTQPRVLARLGERASVVPLRDLGPAVRYMAGRAAMAELERRIAPADRNCLSFTGSGDFHHITAALLRRFPASSPLSVIVFDRHPDWDRRSPWHCCGSWVNEALRLPQVRQIVMIGLGREDIQGLRINVGPVSALRTGRVAFYPCDSPPSLGIFPPRFPREKAVAPPAATLARGPLPGLTEIRWRHVAAAASGVNSLAAAIRLILNDVPTNDVYLSLDKDCLRPDAAFTNWEPGFLPLPGVVEAIHRIAAERDIVGADITGEYSPVEIASARFRRLAASDRPPGLVSPTGAMLRVNEETNLALLDAFGVERR